VAKEIAGFFGLRCGVIAAKTVTFKKGIQPLSASDEAPSLSIRAEKLGKKLVNRIEAGRRVPTLDSLWIGFLRRVILKRLIKRFPESFKIAIERQPFNTYSLTHRYYF